MASIRRGTEGDLPDIVRIINHYIAETPITFDVEPYTLKTRRPWFDQFAASGRHQIFVPERDGRALGWACSGPWRAKAAYDTTVETGIYLAPEAVGQGLGQRLYEALFDALRGEDLHRIVAGITVPNPASVRLHERVGFRHVGTFTGVGRKFGRYHDVAWYERAA